LAAQRNRGNRISEGAWRDRKMMPKLALRRAKEEYAAAHV
jgi:hypothetical protein